jgi:hypothetical protein
MPRFFAFLALWMMLLCLVPPRAIGAPLKGAIKLPEDFPGLIMRKPQGYWLVPNYTIEPLSPLVDPRASMVVVIEGKEPSPAKPQTPHILIEDSRFSPPAVVVQPNTKMTFQNKEPIMHLLEPAAGNFMSVTSIGPGSSVDLSISRPGSYCIRSTEIPHLKLYILVTEASLFTVSDVKGAFAFSDVRPGTYTLRIWYQGEWIHGQPITVKGASSVEIVLPSNQPKE